jgi:hypothetical protein
VDEFERPPIDPSGDAHLLAADHLDEFPEATQPAADTLKGQVRTA